MSDLVELTHTTTHVVDGQAKLLEVFKDKPRILALLASYLGQVQALEDVFWDLFLARWIDTSAGVQLDVIGRIVGEKRQGSLDDEYRAFLRARVKVNRSLGLAQSLLDIVELLQNDALPVYLTEYHPPAVRLEPEGAVIVDAVRVDRMLVQANAAGVALAFVYTPSARANTLMLSDYWGGFALTASQAFGDYESTPVGGGDAPSVIVT